MDGHLQKIRMKPMVSLESKSVLNFNKVPLVLIICQVCFMLNEHRLWNGNSLIGITPYITEISISNYLFIFTVFLFVIFLSFIKSKKKHMILDICYWILIVMYNGIAYLTEFPLFAETSLELKNNYYQFVNFISLYLSNNLINISLAIFGVIILIKGLYCSPIFNKRKVK